jgi:phosphoribosyl 1,2-cyclic phosphodiesterase
MSTMPARVTILGSGSVGNCAYIETDETRLLVDAGLSLRQIRQRLASIGRTPERLTAILITHEHADHTNALAVINDKLRVPIYCNRPTREAIEFQIQAKLECRVFETRNSFEIGDVLVETFEVLHDAHEPVGFLLRAAGVAIGILTDLGQVTKLVIDRVRTANILLIEANHDVKMVQDCPNRPWSVKQRILSRNGHLSNEAAADAVEQLISAELRHLYLGHLSRDCNKPELARRVMSERLEKIGATHVCLEVASQNVPCPTLTA